MANQMSAPRNPLESAPRNPLEEIARRRGLIPPKPYARGLRPPTDAERERFDATNPEMPLNDLALARLEAERLSGAPINPFPPDYGHIPNPTPPSPPDYRIRPTPDYSTPEYANAKAAWFANPRNEGRIYKKEYAFNDPGEPRDNYIYSLPPIGGEMAADPEPEEYDGFVDGGTGQRGFMGDKYMPTPMAQAGPSGQKHGMADNTRPPTDAERANRDAGYALALSDPEEYDRRIQAYYRRPVAEGEQRTMEALLSAADVVARRAPASTAYNAPPVANTAYMPPATDAPVNTAYNAPPVANTAYMPSRRTVPVDTTYRPPASANTTYMPSSAPTYGMSSTPSYGMSNAQTTTPTYGGQIREPSFSPNQAGKYKVDGPRLKNTGGLFNDLNAFFGRPQT
jgi:hypothetical protein